MERRFGALRFVGSIYKLIGIIVLLLTVLAALGACAGILVGGAAFRETAAQSGVPILGSLVGGVIFASIALLYGGALGLTLFAAGDFISLLLALEENTRSTAVMLRGQPVPLAAPPAPH